MDARLKAIRDRKNVELAKLYDENGNRMFLPEKHRQKWLAIEERLQAEVDALMAEARGRMATASERLAAVDSPYRWLMEHELTKVNQVWAPLIREDVEAMSAADLVAAMESAAAHPDKSFRWTMWRYASRQWPAVSEDAGMFHGAAFAAAKDALRLTLMSPAEVEAERRARAELAAGQEILDQAKWVSPRERREFAAKMGVDVANVPEELGGVAA